MNKIAATKNQGSHVRTDGLPAMLEAGQQSLTLTMPAQIRQLVAIMFTDIVGYTAMMGRDERRAFELLDTNRKIQRPIIEGFNGQLIKELGDGILATFSTVSDAVHGASRILEASQANEFQLHIGIHTAEVVFENGDVFGDGVNIASRLQTLAPPGGIYISDSVNNNISNRSEFRTRFVKTEYLKNVKDPIQIYEVVPRDDANAARPLQEQGGTGSLIQGFSSDIFISYRQNDNKVPPGSKTEGWVTEFVNNLRLELEATMKGKVTIYFDQNPHDGLLETHQVDDSLLSRIKSLVFIPIVSQTYCDPESFAWRNEFLKFIQQAQADAFGLSVKLPNGNVSSRILPVRIHELDTEDLQLLEKELKNKLRPVELVFRGPGVNRPLRAREDDPLKNLNKVIYRDQVNKVANAIKEIIYGIKSHESPQAKLEKVKPTSPSLQLPDLTRTVTSVRTMAVKPFMVTGVTDDSFLGEGLAEELSSSLSFFKSFKMSHQDSAALSLEGSLDVTARSIKVKSWLSERAGNNILWASEYESTKADLFQLHSRIISDLLVKLGIPLKESGMKALRKTTTNIPAAQELYWQGRSLWRKRGIDLLRSLDCFQQAATLDPSFAQAYSGVAMANILMGYYNLVPFDESMKRSKEAAFRALDLDASLLEAYLCLAFINHCYEWSWPEAEHNFLKVFSINPQNATALKRYQLCLGQIRFNFEEAEVESLGGVPYFLHACSLLHHGKHEEALASARQATERDPESFMAKRVLGLSYLGLGLEKEALQALNEATQLSNRHPWLLFDLMGAHATVAGNEEAQAILEESLARVHALSARINDFFFPA